jgi:hypothetical protein
MREAHMMAMKKDVYGTGRLAPPLVLKSLGVEEEALLLLK